VSLTSYENTETFLDQFEHIRTSLRRSQLLLGLAWTALVAGACLLALAAADFRLELPWAARIGGLSVAFAAVVLTFSWQVLAPARWWSQPRTAAEIEHRFPQLGQRIRTLVQYGVLTDAAIDDAGVTPALVDALSDQIEEQVQPLDLSRVVPREKVGMALAAAAVPVAVLALAAAMDWEWRVAINRALLGPSVYTTLVVAPGSSKVDQGVSVPVSVEMVGRQRRNVVLHSRPADSPKDPWITTPMQPKEGVHENGAVVPRVATLDKVRAPLSYKIVAGPVESGISTIDVRYPLAIKSVEVDLSPPAYTHLAPSVTKGGDLQTIAGTLATFRVTFDATPSEAVLVFTDPSVRAKKGEPEPKPLVLPLKAEGKSYVAGLTLSNGGRYRIDAKTADGRKVPKNRYRLDIHEDRPPRVSFDEPDEALEVHPVAEVRNRVRVGDDVGLSRAGITFRFNDGEEQTLLLKPFGTGPDDKLTTSATLEEMLMVEKLKATSTDSIIYYAFAEDNFPSGVHRTETDMRYLDIRPFKREYKVAEGEPGDDNGGQSTALNELIARQRFNLNRASRLAHRRPGDRSPAEDPLRIATFEETLVGLVRDFTEGFEGVAGQRVEPLHQAEEAMLASIESLDRGRNTETPDQMSAALRHLIQVRQTFLQVIGRDSAAARAARAFDRTQTQKIRKLKGKDQEAEAVAEELEQLAKEEDFVYATLYGLQMDDDPRPPLKGSALGSNGSEAMEAKEPKEQGKKDASKKQSAAKEQPKSKTGDSGDEEGPGKAKIRREAIERQEKLADEARALEDRLKKLEEVSDLAKQRMSKAAEATEKAAGALGRGNTKEGTDAARAGALMLHELARQVKGEVSREVADELAMARDLADELARREEEFASGSDSKDDPSGESGKGEAARQGEGEPKGKADGKSPGSGTGNGPGWDGWGDWNKLSQEERLQRMEEAARTLEEWLKGAGKNAEGDAAERVREVLLQGPPGEIVERTERVGTLYLGGQKEGAREEAKALAQTLEALARRLDAVHRGIVAPELARLTELDRRANRLAARLQELKSEGQIAEWRRLAAELARDLEKAGLTEAAAELNRLLASATTTADWHAGPDGLYHAPAAYTNAVQFVVSRLQERVQDLILKDLSAARDEATPPQFRELVDRYYEVLSSEADKEGAPSPKATPRPDRPRRGMR
jgi:hypothetical protein